MTLRALVLLVLLVLLPTLCVAQNFTGYRASTLDAVFDELDDITKTDEPGLSVLRPQKVKFVASYQMDPKPCGNWELETALKMMGYEQLLRKVQITHCIGFSSKRGRKVVAYVQDALVPGLKSDARLGTPIEIYPDVFGYSVEPDRSRNRPILMVSRFEPQ